jgi:transcriptional regulator
MSYVPFLLNRTDFPLGSLQCHVAKSNSIWRGITKGRITAIFSGPHAYISPCWYSSEDQVPTWNYSAVFAEGQVRLLDDNQLAPLLIKLTNSEESRTWNNIKWPTREVGTSKYGSMMKAIVGIELQIEKIYGKLKMSQNRSSEDRAGAVKALLESSCESDAAVAKMIKETNEK